MKTKLWFASVVVFVASCEAPVSPVYRSASTPTAPSTGASVAVSPGTTATGNYGSVQSPPDAELLYQRRESDAFGSSTYTSRTQVRGPVVEEIHIGNQQVLPHQPVYGPTTINGVVQPGYVPSGTTGVYDPTTGRVIPVRRR